MSQILPLIKRLAQNVREQNGEGRLEKFFVFKFGQTSYAVPAVDVAEVAMPAALIEIPQKSDLIMGVVNIRGIVIPVINLRKRMGIDPAFQTSENTRLLLFSVKAGAFVGLIADDIEYRLREGIIEPSAHGSEGTFDRTLRIAVIENQRVPVFMIDAWLEKPEFEILQNVVESF